MKLHGHTRLELTDIHTGAVEVVEKDNIITNAVGEIFNGYGGSLNKAMLLWRGQQDDPNAPKDLVTMFYGGCSCMTAPSAQTRQRGLPRRRQASRARRSPVLSMQRPTRPAAAPT